MKIEQLSIFMENRSGRLSHVINTLGDAGINIRALSIADTSDFGILRLIVNDTDKAKTVLKAKGFTVNTSEVVALEIPDRPGELGKILTVLEQVGINVEYMYAFVQKSMENAVVIFRFDSIDHAVEAILKKGIAVLKRSTIQNL